MSLCFTKSAADIYWTISTTIYLSVYSAIVVNDLKLITELFNETASTGKQIDDPVMTEITKGPYGNLKSCLFIKNYV